MSAPNQPRARNARLEGPTKADVVDLVDCDEEDPLIYARQGEDEGDCDPAIGDCRNYGKTSTGHSRRQACRGPVSQGRRYPQHGSLKGWRSIEPHASATTFPTKGRGAGETPREPYEANEEQRFQIALVPNTINDWVEGITAYRQLRLPTEGVSGTGKSFVIHFPTGLFRQILGSEGASRLYARKGIAAFQVGGSTGRRILQIPACRNAFGQLESLRGDVSGNSRWF